MNIGLDFDATVVKNEHPFIGAEIPNCIRVLEMLVKANHQIILSTMRTDSELVAALRWFEARGIPIQYVNCNPEYETGSRKVYFGALIDNKAIGIPLVVGEHYKPYVDWYKVEEILRERKFI